MRLLLCVLSALVLVSCGDGSESTVPNRHSVHTNDRNFSQRDHVKEPRQQQQVLLGPTSGSAFDLKVQVDDALTRQQLSQASVEVYVNYTRISTALTGEDGSVLLHVPHQTGMPIAIVASKDGYICTLLPCKTDRTPIFSSVTMSLLGRTQGNIWLFEDSVLITGKTSDASSRPVVQFPKSLLNLTDGSNVTSVKAYLTVPRLPSEEDNYLNTLGIMSRKSGYVSVELSPVAAVSVQLFSGDTELHVSGPVQISLSLPDSSGLQASNVVPAWFFNRTTGGWMRKGLGSVASSDGKLVWTFTAPHLGYWIAAPLSPTRRFFGLDIPVDFILQHSSLLIVILGGMLVIVTCLLVVLLCNCSGTQRKKILPVMRRDQTTSTCDEDEEAEKEANLHDVISNPSAVAIAVDCNDLELNDLNGFDKATQQIRVPASLTDSLFFYNQPVAILHAPAFFHLDEQPDEPQWSRSATLPRTGATNGAATESKDSFTQTAPKGSSANQSQAEETEDQLEVLEGSQAAASTKTSRGHFSLPESASVPGTLNNIRGGRHSVHTLAELSRIPSLQPPRAWFVSLEGKPAAEIHYAVSEQQRRRRPVESRETSLDSGVDMSELNQTPGRRAVTLERNNTFVKSSSGSKDTPPQ